MRSLTSKVPSFIHRPNYTPNRASPPVTRDGTATTTWELEEANSDKKMLLVGTLNASKLQAERTRASLAAFSPDLLVVQTTEAWFDAVRASGSTSPKTTRADKLPAPSNAREVLHFSRFLLWRTALRAILGLTGAWEPGWEVFRAVEWARAHGVPVHFAGAELGLETATALRGSKGLSLMPVLRTLAFSGAWVTELTDLRARTAQHGLQAIAEYADAELSAWLAAFIGLLAPGQRTQMFDDRAEALVRMAATASRPACVLNLWHVPGVTRRWAKPAGRFVNPVGDVPLSEMQRQQAAERKLLELRCKLARTEPATESTFLTQYVKQATEWERERHGFFHGHADPHLEHLLYGGENAHVADLPYRRDH